VTVCDICSDLIGPGGIHYCPPVDDRYDSAELLPIRLEYYQDHP
jgi:hypothetical protein